MHARQVPDHDCAAAHGVKVHTLSAERGGELRLVLIKKAGDQPLLFNITVTGGLPWHANSIQGLS